MGGTVLRHRNDELLALDANNGDEQWSLRTLSGDESFLASLSHDRLVVDGRLAGMTSHVRDLADAFQPVEAERVRQGVDADRELYQSGGSRHQAADPGRIRW